MAAFEATKRIARFVGETTLDDVPTAAVDTAKAAFTDTLGVALAGSRDNAGVIAARIAREEGAREEASVIGHGFRTSAQQAAFTNGIAVHALDYDHSFDTGGQPMAPVIPASLALAEASGASGRRLLEAYVVGFEVGAKISQSVHAATPYAWHAPGIVGVIAATAASAKLLELSQAQTRLALGIAVSMAGGVEANFGTMTKPLHVGHAARNGVVAAKLVAAGFTASNQAIEAEVGFYDAYYHVTPGDDSSLKELGASWALEEIGLRIKPYPSGGLAHTAIDAALHLRAEHLVAAANGAERIPAKIIESIDVEVTQRTFDRIIFRIPQTELEAKFSMPYLVACALVTGQVGLDAFTDNAIKNPAVIAVAEKVSMRLAQDLVANREGRPARLTIRLRDGGTLTRHVQAAKGGDVIPMTPDEFLAKFHECAARTVDSASADLLVDAIRSLDTAPDLQQLTTLLRGEAI